MEKTLKVQSLLKEGFDIDDTVKITTERSAEKLSRFRESVQTIITDSDWIRLTDDTREVSDNIAGYIANKLGDLCKGCCERLLTTDSGNTNMFSYFHEVD